MRVLMLVGLLLGAAGAQAQIADAWGEIVVTATPALGGAGRVTAEARCFTSRGPALGNPCSGEIRWELYRCEGWECHTRRRRGLISP